MTSAHTTKKKQTNRWVFVLYIGFFAGLIWGALKIVENYFKFTTIGIGFLVEPFFKHDFFNTWLGLFIGWVVFALFSIFAAFIYMVTMWKLRSPFWGIGYGALWWAIYLSHCRADYGNGVLDYGFGAKYHSSVIFVYSSYGGCLLGIPSLLNIQC